MNIYGNKYDKSWAIVKLAEVIDETIPDAIMTIVTDDDEREKYRKYFGALRRPDMEQDATEITESTVKDIFEAAYQMAKDKVYMTLQSEAYRNIPGANDPETFFCPQYADLFDFLIGQFQNYGELGHAFIKYKSDERRGTGPRM